MPYAIPASSFGRTRNRSVHINMGKSHQVIRWSKTLLSRPIIPKSSIVCPSPMTAAAARGMDGTTAGQFIVTLLHPL